DVAKSAHNVAGVLYFMGHVDEAEAMYRRGLASFEAAVGPRHPYVAKAALNLGEVLRDRGKTAEAEAYLLRALEIEIEAYGPDAASGRPRPSARRSPTKSAFPRRRRRSAAASPSRRRRCRPSIPGRRRPSARWATSSPTPAAPTTRCRSSSARSGAASPRMVT